MDFDDNNPFAEPVHQSATGQSFSSQPAQYDTNPFTSTAPSTPPPPPVSPSAVYVPPPSAPVYQAPTYTPTSPTYSPTSPSYYQPAPAPVITAAPYYSTDHREASTRVDVTPLERQQAELADREKRLNGLDKAAVTPTPITIRTKNFPPLPKSCPIGPCFYHDIQLDIPGPLQRWARFLYILWIVYAVTLLLNMIGGLSYFIVDSSGGTTFGLSLVYFVLFVPLSYICWYRPIYRALRTDSSVYYMLFFFISVLFIANNALFATGLVAGMCGFNRLGVMSDDKVVGVMMLVLSILWTLNAVAAVLLTIKVHRIYRSSGASIEQAQRELQTAIVTNETVRGVARDAARDAAVVGINEAMRTDRP